MRFTPLAFALLLCSCSGPRPIEDQSELVGCFVDPRSNPVLEVGLDGTVAVAGGVVASSARLVRQGSVSLVEFTPALVSTQGGQVAKVTEKSSNQHLVLAAAGEVAIGLENESETEWPSTPLVRRDADPCQWKG